MRDSLDGCSIDFTRHAQSDRRNEEMLAELERDARQTRTLAAVSSGGRDLDLAARLRRDGLKVIEVGGWQTRGHATLNPRGAVTHHTAGPAATSTRRAPSLGIIINGRSDLAGPLANTYIDYDGNVYVIASGKANHAGLADRRAIPWGVGNSDVWGLEIEHPGTFPLPANIAEIAARVQAATVRGTVGADRVVYHKEWAPSRKIDLATAPGPAEHRRQVAAFLASTNPPEEDDMTKERVLELRKLAFEFAAGGRVKGTAPRLPIAAESAIFYNVLLGIDHGLKAGDSAALRAKIEAAKQALA